jgi:hypothetical protein
LGHEGYHQQQNIFNNRPYVGLIDVIKAREDYPVYRQGEKINWSVVIPKDFYGQKTPPLTCTLIDEFDKSQPIRIAGRFLKEADGRLFYNLSHKLQKTGAFTSTLSFGDKTAMKRRDEVIVFGAVPQPKVIATKIFTSLKRTLVDEIDCTKPTDAKNPVILSGRPGSAPIGKVVQKGKLKYFQTGPDTVFLGRGHYNNYAMWKLRADKLNQFYLVEIDLPEDRDRVQIIALVHGIAGYECGTESTVETGFPRPVTNKIITHRILFIPKFHDVRILISPVLSSRKRNGAAVKAIRFYRIDGNLPQVKLGDSGRKASTYNERANLPGISYYPGSDAFQKFQGKNLNAPGQYRRWYLALKNHIQILRMSAQNAVCHGLYMYVKEEYPVRAGDTDFVRLMQDMYGANGIDFYGNSQYFTSSRLEGRALGHKVKGTKVSDAEVAKGVDTCRLVSKDGKQAPNYPMNNPSHSRVQKDIARVFKDISKRYAVHQNFHGMMVFAGTMGCAMSFRDLNWGYGDCTYNLFRKKSRTDAPGFTGAKRFRKRYAWIMKNAKADFIKFRCKELYDLNKTLLDILKKNSPKSKLLVNMCAWPWRKNIGNGSVAELKKRFLGTGADPAIYYNNPSMLVLHNDWMGAHISGNKELKMAEDYNRNPKIWKYVTGGKPCGSFFWTGYYETALYLPSQMLNQCWFSNSWFFNYQKRFIGSAGKLGRNYLSAYTNAMAYANPVMFLNRFTDVAEHRGFIDMKAEAGEAISYIPQGSYQTAPGSNQQIVLKVSGKNAYLVNNTPQSQNVTVKSGNLINPVIGGKLIADKGYIGLKMKPYQIMPLRLISSHAGISIKKELTVLKKDI